MSKKNLEQLIENAKSELHNENLVAFLGELKSGKTVVSALLKHALFNHFVPRSREKYEAIVSGGSTIINETLGSMIKDGLFPQGTWPIKSPVISMEIHTMKGRGPGVVKLILRDISGENYVKLLLKEYSNPEDRLYDVLMFNKDEKKSVGPLAHIVFAKVYVIIIDCSSDNPWEHEQSYAAQMITALRQMKEIINDTENGKIVCPIAIIFTKTDLLSTDSKSLPAEELMKKMPELMSSLKISHDGSIAYFKMFVDVEEENPEDVQLRIKRDKAAAKEEFEIDQHEKNLVMKKAIEKAGTDAKNKAITEGRPAEADVEAQEAREATATAFRSEPEKEFQFDSASLSKPLQKVKLPLRYSHSQYIKFISWLIQSIKR